MPMTQKFHSNGKLLLTGEYAVLDGALALAIPVKFGQTLTVSPSEKAGLLWKSHDQDGKIWYEGSFGLQNNTIKAIQTDDTSNRLLAILSSAKTMNPEFLTEEGYTAVTELEFPAEWGLGSSSTLINNIASWAGVDALHLLDQSFGGSGYDIAAAQRDSAFTYRRGEGAPEIHEVDLKWDFTDRLFFVHLNQKQSSTQEIERYKTSRNISPSLLDEISAITTKLVNTASFSEFNALITEHESVISDLIAVSPIKESRFPDFGGAVKSLGAWGGDFILATGKVEDMEYFRSKGYNTILPFSKMIK